MAVIRTWSTTASSNNSAAPDGWPEGQAANTVNDCAREMMAQIKTWYETAEWISLYAVTYASSTTFTIASTDVTSIFTVGRRVKAVGSSTGTIYGIITASAFATNTTVTVAWDSGSLSNESLTVYVGILNPTNQSIPTIVDNQPVVCGSSDRTKKVRFEVDGLTTATTRVITAPDADITLVGTSTTQTLSNKTLQSPSITGLTTMAVTTAVRCVSMTSDQTGQELARATATSNSYANVNTFLATNTAAGTGFSFLQGASDLDGTPDTEFNLRGDGNAYADGAWNGSGADYQEYFESVSGTALPVGKTVVLEGNKVRVATGDDAAAAIIGVVRPKEPNKNSAVVGNTAWNHWADKYLTDDYGRYAMEEYQVYEWTETLAEINKETGENKVKNHSYASYKMPQGVEVPEGATVKTMLKRKLNPAWAGDDGYIPREGRPEWNLIGLLGQIQVEKGQPVGDRWIKMRDISETVEEWYVR